VIRNRLGVIDSLSAGLNFVVGRLWIVLIPVLLDFWYWLGPRLSVAPLVRQVEAFVATAAQQSNVVTPLSIEEMQQVLEGLSQHFNLFSLLSAGLLGMPSLMGSASAGIGGVIEVHSWLVLLGLVPLLTLVGFAIGCLYLTLIANGLRAESPPPMAILRQTGLTWLRVLGLALILLFIAIAIGVPFAFLVSLVALLSPGVAMFLFALFYMSTVWIALYLYFVVDAIVINEVGPLRAIWYSANVVARNFWSALGLILLIMLLSAGLSFVWAGLGRIHPLGTVIGIAGHAFIGTGLVAASLIFYRDRYTLWQKEQAQQVRT